MRLITLLLVCATVVAGPTPPAREPVRISAWYWLNSAPRDEWRRDFRAMADLGFTHVALCWGLDAAAWPLRQEDTRYALDEVRSAGMGAYFIVWHPVHNSLTRNPAHQQVDSAGNLRFAFDAFHREWRQNQWKEYLQTVARLYAGHPAFSGYMFDDTFGIGPIGGIGGPSGKREERYISYNAFDKRLYGKEPPKSPQDSGWADWTRVRSQWWQEWSKETVGIIRAVDPDPKHLVYLEDSISTIFNPEIQDRAGLNFASAAAPWDAVGAYTTPKWTGEPDSGVKQAQLTTEALEKVRQAVGSGKTIIYTFWVANILELNQPGPARFPAAAQIRQICEAALQAGIRHLDMYGYRIGDYVVTTENWPQKRPPAVGPYPITGQYPHKHLYDRLELHSELRQYLRSLRNR